jgi:hypothetical protein
MKPTRGTNLSAWCSTFAAIRRGLLVVEDCLRNGGVDAFV